MPISHTETAEGTEADDMRGSRMEKTGWKRNRW